MHSNWQGDIDGLLIVDIDGKIRELDRPGDLVSMMMNTDCPSDIQAATLLYGYCLATQGVLLPHLVRQVLGKIGSFLRSVSMDSMELYQAIGSIDEFIRESSLEGNELRTAVLDEVTRYHQQIVTRT